MQIGLPFVKKFSPDMSSAENAEKWNWKLELVTSKSSQLVLLQYLSAPLYQFLSKTASVHSMWQIAFLGWDIWFRSPDTIVLLKSTGRILWLLYSKVVLWTFRVYRQWKEHRFLSKVFILKVKNLAFYLLCSFHSFILIDNCVTESTLKK